MEIKRELLLKSAARLYSLGLDIDTAKEKVKKLAASETPYDSPEMIQAVQDYTELKTLWDNLEQEYLKLKAEIQSE